VANCGVSFSDSDSDSGSPPGKKEYIFTNKKDAVDAFKNLLRDKVSAAMLCVCVCACCGMQQCIMNEFCIYWQYC